MTGAWRGLLVAALVAPAVVPALAWAGPPTEAVRTRIEEVIRVLEDPALRADDRVAERRAMIRRIAHELFDFEETTRRSLGRHWQARSFRERAEFVALFADLLERTYIGQIEQYNGEPMVFASEAVDGGHATVRTRLAIKGGGEVPVDYRLHRRDGRWRVYDVSIEGVSLVGNYRAQFNRIIQASSYDGLVQRLRARVDEGEAAGAAPPR